jgi:hypothetical protein
MRRLALVALAVAVYGSWHWWSSERTVHHLDSGAGVAPIDLGIGWGPLSDSAMLEGLEFSQMGRFFY